MLLKIEIIKIILIIILYILIFKVKRLLERYRISPNFKDSKGRTPLHFACSSGIFKIKTCN